MQLTFSIGIEKAQWIICQSFNMKRLRQGDQKKNTWVKLNWKASACEISHKALWLDFAHGWVLGQSQSAIQNIFLYDSVSSTRVLYKQHPLCSGCLSQTTTGHIYLFYFISYLCCLLMSAFGCAHYSFKKCHVDSFSFLFLATVCQFHAAVTQLLSC